MRNRGWLTSEETDVLRKSVEVFSEAHRPEGRSLQGSEPVILLPAYLFSSLLWVV